MLTARLSGRILRHMGLPSWRDRRRAARGLRFICLLAALALLCVVSTAQASFHLMKVREVYTGGASGGSYVELQMFAANQNFVGGHHVTTYNATGGLVNNYTIPNDVTGTNAGENQKTILFAGPGYSGPAADFTNPALDLPASAGAVCFDAIPVDCVSWGAFTGNASLPSSAAPPASPGGVTAGKALRRSIALGCPTLLEAGDDTDSSATDFSEQTPDPRPNSAAVVEKECTAPKAKVTSGPANPTKETSASFTYESEPPGATFECSLDSTVLFESCSEAGKSYPGPLSENTHTFRVKATDVNGTGAAVAFSWKIDLTPPTVFIDTEPANPSPGNSVTFTFHGSETVAKFECSLDEGAVTGAFSECSSPKGYTSLADGTYTFNVKATDPAGNPGLPTSYEWVVDNSLKDETPPETTITAAPPDPSVSSTAAFSYGSNEASSNFECALDGAAFVSCSPAGAIYTGLANGPHSFQVRATDSSGNTDQTPAGYSWSVAVLNVTLPPPFSPPPPGGVPQTTITRKPGAVTTDRTPTFRFKSSIANSTFECKLDRAPFRPCVSPLTLRPLAPGAHVLRVRAIAAGQRDPTPERVGFIVKRHKRRR